MPKTLDINGINIPIQEDGWINITLLIVALSLEHATESLFKYFMAGDYSVENGDVHVPLDRVAPIVHRLDIQPLSQLLESKGITDKSLLFDAPFYEYHAALDPQNPGQPLANPPEEGRFPVFLTIVNNIEVMRKDNLVNASQLMKAANVDPVTSTSLLKSFESGFHELVKEPPSRSGVWIPLIEARNLARRFNLQNALKKLLWFEKEPAESYNPLLNRTKSETVKTAPSHADPTVNIEGVTINGITIERRSDGWIDLQAIIRVAQISKEDRKALLREVLLEKLKKYEVVKGQIWADRAAAYDLAGRLDLLAQLRPLLTRSM